MALQHPRPSSLHCRGRTAEDRPRAAEPCPRSSGQAHGQEACPHMRLMGKRPCLKSRTPVLKVNLNLVRLLPRLHTHAVLAPTAPGDTAPRGRTIHPSHSVRTLSVLRISTLSFHLFIDVRQPRRPARRRAARHPADEGAARRDARDVHMAHGELPLTHVALSAARSFSAWCTSTAGAFFA